MNFKEALIAHLNGEKVEAKRIEDQCAPWVEWSDSAVLSGIPVNEIASHLNASLLEFRLAPRTIIVNGVEVPAPEKIAPEKGAKFYIPVVVEDWHNAEHTWTGCRFDYYCLEKGLVYLREEDMIARSKAMLIVKEV